MKTRAKESPLERAERRVAECVAANIAAKDAYMRALKTWTKATGDLLRARDAAAKRKGKRK